MPDLFVDSLARELDRASRYGRELMLVVLLEAAELSFPHPITDARIEATSPLPPDLELVLSRNTL